MRRSPLLLLATGIVVCGAYSARSAVSPGAASVSRKLERIESGRLQPGTRIDFSTPELNAWLREEARSYFGKAVSNMRIEPGYNSATGYADIDFVKLRQAATGEEPGWLMRNLFAGDRAAVVKLHFASEHGRIKVDLDRVQLSGVSIEGSALDFLVSNYVRPTFPDVKLSEWVRLADGVDHIGSTPGGASVFIGR